MLTFSNCLFLLKKTKHISLKHLICIFIFASIVVIATFIIIHIIHIIIINFIIFINDIFFQIISILLWPRVMKIQIWTVPYLFSASSSSEFSFSFSCSCIFNSFNCLAAIVSTCIFAFLWTTLSPSNSSQGIIIMKYHLENKKYLWEYNWTRLYKYIMYVNRVLLCSCCICLNSDQPSTHSHPHQRNKEISEWPSILDDSSPLVLYVNW